MDVFQFAMQKEKDAEQFYRDLAANSRTDGIRHIFNMLADAEVRHYNVVKDMQDHTPDVPPSNIMEDALKDMREARKSMDLDKVSEDHQLDAYLKARQLEEESIKLYSEQAEKAEDEASQRIFRQLTNQEKMHYVLLDNMAEFVSKPEEWLEDAEFTHILDKYRGTDYYPDDLPKPE